MSWLRVFLVVCVLVLLLGFVNLWVAREGLVTIPALVEAPDDYVLVGNTKPVKVSLVVSQVIKVLDAAIDKIAPPPPPPAKPETYLGPRGPKNPLAVDLSLFEKMDKPPEKEGMVQEKNDVMSVYPKLGTLPTELVKRFTQYNQYSKSTLFLAYTNAAKDPALQTLYFSKIGTSLDTTQYAHNEPASLSTLRIFLQPYAEVYKQTRRGFSLDPVDLVKVVIDYVQENKTSQAALDNVRAFLYNALFMPSCAFTVLMLTYRNHPECRSKDDAMFVLAVAQAALRYIVSPDFMSSYVSGKEPLGNKTLFRKDDFRLLQTRWIAESTLPLFAIWKMQPDTKRPIVDVEKVLAWCFADDGYMEEDDAFS
jgi:hypothetical protein